MNVARSLFNNRGRMQQKQHVCMLLLLLVSAPFGPKRIQDQVHVGDGCKHGNQIRFKKKVSHLHFFQSIRC